MSMPLVFVSEMLMKTFKIWRMNGVPVSLREISAQMYLRALQVATVEDLLRTELRDRILNLDARRDRSKN